MKIRSAALACLVSTAAFFAGRGQDPHPDEHLLAVRAFEERLGEVEDEAGKAALTRELFGGIEDLELLLEAMGAIDSRYVSRVPRDVALEVLAGLVVHEDLAVRARAAMGLRRLERAGEHADALVAILEDATAAEDHDALEKALYAMGSTGHERFHRTLEEHLDHGSLDVRRAAIYARTSWIWQQIRELADLAADEDAETRAAVIQSLPMLRGDVAVGAVLARLDDEDEEVRVAAVKAIQAFGRRDEAGSLVRSLGDRSPGVRSSAAQAIGLLRAFEWADRVALLLDDRELIVRRYAVRAMAEIGADRHVERLRAFADDEDGYLRTISVEAIERIEAR